MSSLRHTLAASALLGPWLVAGCYASGLPSDDALVTPSVDAAPGAPLGAECESDSDCVAPLSCARWFGNPRLYCATRCDRRTNGDRCDDGSLCAGYFGGDLGSQGWCFPGGRTPIGGPCNLITCELGAACRRPVIGVEGMCVAACDVEADCGPTERCWEGACTPVCEPSAPNACPEGSVCDRGVCTLATLLISCFDGGTCELGTICRSTPTWHECVAPDDARYVTRCGEGRILVDGVCYPRGA